jgi:putative FmdB family regulatory protein
MPNYEYLCRKCDHHWEDIQTIANRDTPTEQPCPQCGAAAVARGWDHAPTMGVDAGVKPSGAFRERMESMRSKLGKYNPRVRNNIDRALDHKGTKSGPQ